MGKPITDWEIDERGAAPSVMTNAGAEYTPVKYPRSGDDRGIETSNKGGASQADVIDASVAANTTGNINVERHADTPIDYTQGGTPDDETDV